MAGKNTKIIRLNAGRGYSASEERYDFIEAVKSAIPCKPTEDLCHYISFNYIKKVLTESADYFFQGTFSAEAFHENITKLCEAVTTGERQIAEGEDSEVDEVYEQIEDCKENLAGIGDSDRRQDLSAVLNTLLYYLNSVDANLRPGSKNWNRSIGSEFDPHSWVHCGADGKIDSSNITVDDETADEIFEKNCFYLASGVDCAKYALLDELNVIAPPSFYSAVYGGKKILYSSNNGAAFNPNRNRYQECGEPVYYDTGD